MILRTMNSYYITYYYTLADIYGEETDAWSALINKFTFADIFQQYATGADLSDLDNNILNEFLKDYIWPRFSEQYVGLITRRICEDEPTEEELEKVFAGKAALIYSWLQGSRKRYETLINIYNTEKDNLMSQLGTTTTTETTTNLTGNDTEDINDSSNGSSNDTTTSTEMYSDTPQDGAAFTEGRTTNATKTSSTTDRTNESTGTSKRTSSSESNGSENSTVSVKQDAGTIMSRIKEIQENIRAVYNDWSAEFRRFVIYA